MTDLAVFQSMLAHERPERILADIPAYGLSYRGVNHEDAQGVGHDRPAGESWQDMWQVTWHKDLDDVMGFPQRHPLEDLEDLDAFTFPDPDDPHIHGTILAQKQAYDERGLSGSLVLSGSHRDTLWERSYMLVGMEDMMAYFYTEPELVHALLTRIMDFQLGMAKYYLQAGVQIVSLSDDMGTQHSLLLGEKIFDTFLMPQYDRLISMYRKHGVRVNFHSCGHVQPLLSRFIALGIDILNPIQARANDLDALRAATRGKLLLCGGVDSPTIADGTPAEIDALVKLRIEQLGRDGEYICTPDQHMPFTQENLDAWRLAVEKYGRLA